MSSTESVSPHDVILCACGTREYTARDAIDAATFRSELEDEWQKFLRHIAAEGRADELELELDESAISAAAEEFRYRHDLITAEETEAWLANRGLTFDNFSDYFARQYCVGAVDEGFWLEQLGRDSQWLNEMLAIQAAYGAHCDTLLVPEARQRELMALRLHLTRFEIELIELESHDAAKEAQFCVREDGMSMEEVATEGRYPYRRADFLLEDLPADAQQKYLSVSPGNMLEPMPHGDGFELCRIIKKVEPRLEDPSVKSRVDQRLLDQYFSDLTTKYTYPRLTVPVSVE